MVQILNNYHMRGRGVRKRPMSEINVTPFVDVVLVLLVIFMITAPLLTSGVQVNLPETSATPVSGQDEPLSITIDAEGAVYLQNSKVQQKDLIQKLQAITGRKPDTRIFVRADKIIEYGKVMEVVSLIAGAGFTKVAFITENPSGS